MPAPSYANQGGTLFGVESDETAVNILGCNIDAANPKVHGNDRYGGRVRFAYDFDVSQKYALNGETTTTLPLAGGFAFGVAETIANAIDGFGTTSGGNYMDDISFNAAEGALRTFTANFERINGLT